MFNRFLRPNRTHCHVDNLMLSLWSRLFPSIFVNKFWTLIEINRFWSFLFFNPFQDKSSLPSSSSLQVVLHFTHTSITSKSKWSGPVRPRNRRLLNFPVHSGSGDRGPSSLTDTWPDSRLVFGYSIVWVCLWVKVKCTTVRRMTTGMPKFCQTDF